MFKCIYRIRMNLNENKQTIKQKSTHTKIIKRKNHIQLKKKSVSSVIFVIYFFNYFFFIHICIAAFLCVRPFLKARVITICLIEFIKGAQPGRTCIVYE